MLEIRADSVDPSRSIIADEDDPEMRIHANTMRCVGFIVRDQGKDRVPIGTAFFVGIDATPETGGYVVTARHVIEAFGKNETVWVRVNRPNGAAFKDFGIKRDKWRFHPSDNTVDAAAAEWPDEMESKTESAFFTTNLGLATRDSIEYGQTVIMLGLFTNHAGKSRIQPIVRVGNVALLPGEPVTIDIDRVADVILIESRSIGGLSGSPVFLMRGIIEGAKFNSGIGVGDGWIAWMGIIQGHWDVNLPKEDVVVEDGRRESINMGIALVVPADRVIEVFNQEAFRMRHAEQLAKKRAESFPKMDTASRKRGKKTADVNTAASSMIDELARRTEGRPKPQD